MKEYYQQTVSEVLERVGQTQAGWNSAQASELLEKHGPNALREGKRKNVLQMFAEQFRDLMVIILIIAAVISMISGNAESTLVIFAVLIINAVLGTVQNRKAEKSLDSLKSLASPSAKVIRGGVTQEIDSTQVVPGDIVVLEAGDMVVADGRVIDSFSLQVNESSLTGESTNVDKSSGVIDGQVPLGDRVNMVYSGSLVTYGRAVIAVTATGMDTEIGRIASMMNATKEKKTPLQRSLDQFSSRLAVVIMMICAIVFLLGLFRGGLSILDSLLFAVALAVAAIPEALSSIVTIVQAMGTQKMVREHAIIKELKAVESLGSVSVICSDKTGTLTQNKMTVQDVYIDEHVIPSSRLTLDDPIHRMLLYNAILTNDSSLRDGQTIGDPTEFCLLEMAEKINVPHQNIRAQLSRLEEIPFDSDRKLMTTRYEIDGKELLLTKGAPDVLLNRSGRLLTSDGIRSITDADRERIVQANMQFSQDGLRVLAFAYKDAPADREIGPEDEHDYTFIGLISMMDPPREESMEAVAEAKRAGIRPVMITGDHKITATAIAKKIGIFEEGDLAVTGLELDAMSEDELNEKVEKISVYARVSPENKIRIVDAWQNKGHITAMTGDGVNDAPALKKADIGVAMGITGTEVSKDAAAMILTDDNFATIIKAVANGRNVFRNIKNSIEFLLSGNMAGIFAVLYASLAALPVPFAAVHLLFINLLTDSLPALAIGMENPEKDLLNEKPRDPNQGIMTKDFLHRIFFQGALIAIVTMTAFHLGMQVSHMTGMTMAFSTLTIARLFHGFNCRSRHSIFRLRLTSNKYTIGAFFLGLLLLNLVLFVPFLRPLFMIADLTACQYGMIYALAFLPTIVIQTVKVVQEHRKQ